MDRQKSGVGLFLTPFGVDLVTFWELELMKTSCHHNTVVKRIKKKTYAESP